MSVCVCGGGGAVLLGTCGISQVNEVLVLVVTRYPPTKPLPLKEVAWEFIRQVVTT